MLKILSTLFLVLILILFPPTTLIIISQNAVKGDSLYPVKRGLETGTLFIVSLTPYTKAYFAVALANRRYEEMSVLLSQGDDADSTIQELVVQAGVAAGDISKVSNANQRSKLIADLSSSIDKYDQGLAKAQEEIAKTNTGQGRPTASFRPVDSGSTPKPSSTNPNESANRSSPQVNIPPRPTQLPSQSEEEFLRKKEMLEKARRELEEVKRILEEERRRLRAQGNNFQQDSSKHNSLPSPSPIPSPSLRPSPSPQPSPSIAPSPSPTAKASTRSAHSASLERSAESAAADSAAADGMNQPEPSDNSAANSYNE